MASMAAPALAFAPRAPTPEASAAPALSIRVLDWPCCGAPSIVSRWDILARRAAEPNPFLESWYLLPALRASATAAEQPLPAGVFSNRAAPVAAAPDSEGNSPA